MNAPQRSAAWEWRHAVLKSGLPPTTRHVLLTLSCYMNALGQGCYPSTEDLMDATGLSKPAVLKHVNAAIEAGWLVRANHGLRGRKWKRAEYEPRWPGRDVLPEDEPGEAGAGDQGGKRGLPASPGEAVNEVNQGGKRGLPEAVNEVDHVIDQSNNPSNHQSRIERESAQARSDQDDGDQIDPPDPDDPLFDRFMEIWPTAAADDRGRNFAAWAQLEPAARTAAVEAVPEFLRYLRRLGRSKKPSGWSYLHDRKWERLQAAASGGAPATLPVARFSRVWWRTFFDAIENRRDWLVKYMFEHSGREVHVRREWVADDARCEAMRNVRFDGADWPAWRDWIARRTRLTFEAESDPDKLKFYFVPADRPPPRVLPASQSLAGRGDPEILSVSQSQITGDSR